VGGEGARRHLAPVEYRLGGAAERGAAGLRGLALRLPDDLQDAVEVRLELIARRAGLGSCRAEQQDQRQGQRAADDRHPISRPRRGA
jgi:hypothetical protein